MKNIIPTLLGCTLCVAISAQNYNPIIPDNLADPSVCKFGDTFYLYGTTDVDAGLAKAGIPVVWKSTDFVNWSFDGSHITGIDWNKDYPGYYRYWAPGKVIEKGGRYFLFVTLVKPDESKATYVMDAARPDGPFDFTQATPVVDDIDGEPFVDTDGNAYLFWRRRKAAQLSADYRSVTDNRTEMKTKRGGYSEGPLMFKRDGIYYYVYTLCGHENYVNAYMMSKEGPLSGFKSPIGNDIFVYSSVENDVWGPGHGNVYHDAASDTHYFAYLEYGAGGTTRQVFVNKMEFNDDGTIRTLVPNRKGVGYLSKNSERRTNLALKGILTASSHAEAKTVAARIETDPNQAPKLSSRIQQSDRESVKEVKRTFSFTPEMAANASNGTRWMAAEGDSAPWIMLDLQKKRRINECRFAFTRPADGHAWILEKSVDGINWTRCGEQNERKACSPHRATQIGKTRYLRLTFTEGDPGLWEWQVY